MKLLTHNFLTCAIKSCKTVPTSFPLAIRDAELEIVETDFQPEFLVNILPRVDVTALKAAANDLGLRVPDAFVGQEDGSVKVVQGVAEGSGKGEGGGDGDVEMDVDAEPPASDALQEGTGAGGVEQEGGMEVERSEEDYKKLHRLLLETNIESGTLVCQNCKHEYKILEGIPNFLLPPHLV